MRLTSRKDRDEVDEKIVKAVSTGAKHFKEIYFAASDGLSKRIHMREVDRALQRLRRQKKIQYVKGSGWEVIS